MVPVAAIALAVGGFAGPAQAGNATYKGAAYRLMKAFLGDAHTGFGRVSGIGEGDIYRTTLAGATVKVDPKLASVAVFDPNTNTITFSRDPRTIPDSEAASVGETVWHEVTHAIEDAHGDSGVFDNEAYRERNIDFMTQLARNCRNALQALEKNAREGASVQTLQKNWKQFYREYNRAFSLPSVKEYPPDMAQLKTWFGFDFNPQTIKKFYMNGGFLPGKAGANLRKALKKVDDPAVPTPAPAPKPTPAPAPTTPAPAPSTGTDPYDGSCIMPLDDGTCAGGIPFYGDY